MATRSAGMKRRMLALDSGSGSDGKESMVKRPKSGKEDSGEASDVSSTSSLLGFLLREVPVEGSPAKVVMDPLRLQFVDSDGEEIPGLFSVNMAAGSKRKSESKVEDVREARKPKRNSSAQRKAHRITEREVRQFEKTEIGKIIKYMGWGSDKRTTLRLSAMSKRYDHSVFSFFNGKDEFRQLIFWLLVLEVSGVKQRELDAILPPCNGSDKATYPLCIAAFKRKMIDLMLKMHAKSSFLSERAVCELQAKRMRGNGFFAALHEYLLKIKGQRAVAQVEKIIGFLHFPGSLFKRVAPRSATTVVEQEVTLDQVSTGSGIGMK